LKQQGVDFAELEKRGIMLVVIRIEMDFLYPLSSGDKFYVGLIPERVSRLRFGFRQDIYRLPDEKPILKAKVVGTALNEQGRPRLPNVILELITNSLQPNV
jgi:acyl-CoA thioester hydrolase